MKGLFVKDMCLNFRTGKTILMYLIICFIMGFSMDSEFIIGYATMLFGIMAVGTISYDELDNGMPFLMSLPVDRKSYVTEKFVYSLIMHVAGAVFGMIVYIICSLIKGQDVDVVGALPYVLAIIAVMSMFIFAMIVIELKFGAEKSRLALLIIYGGVAVLLLAVKKIPGVSEAVAKLAVMLESASPVMVAIVLVTAVAVIDLLLYLLALRVMKNKEF